MAEWTRNITKSHNHFHLWTLCPNSPNPFFELGSIDHVLPRKRMIARFVGYMALGIMLVIALIGAYFLGR
jgi:hypothetical protein